MPTDELAVAGPGSCCNGDNAEQADWKEGPTTSAGLRWRAEKQFSALLSLVEDQRTRRYEEFEVLLIAEVFRLGRLLVALFLCLWQERIPVAIVSAKNGKLLFDAKTHGAVRHLWLDRRRLYVVTELGGVLVKDVGFVGDGYCKVLTRLREAALLNSWTERPKSHPRCSQR